MLNGIDNFWDWVECYLDFNFKADTLFFEMTKQGLIEILQSLNKSPE